LILSVSIGVFAIKIFAFSMRYFIEFWGGEWNGGQMGGKFHVLFVFFVAAMFAISLVSLFGYHCYLITKNRSTLESFRSPIFMNGPDKAGFSLGTYYNFLEIFGEDKTKWFLPVFTSLGDGISFPTRQNMSAGATGNYNSIDTTDASSTSPDYDRCVEVKVEANVVNNPADNNSNAGIQNGINNHHRLNEANGNVVSQSTEKDTPLVYF